MRRKQIITGVLAVMTLASAPAAASAQPPESPSQARFSMPTTVRTGGFIGVESTADQCPGGPDGPVESPGFVAPIHLTRSEDRGWTGHGTAVQAEGAFTATLRCKGARLPAEVTFTVIDDIGKWSLHPTEVEPGGKITIDNGTMRTKCWLYDGGPTSPGFAGPVEPTFPGTRGWVVGVATVIDTPGTYEVMMMCGLPSRPFPKSFTILGTPPTSPPAKPKVVKPKVVKPVGAPQTGDGSTS